MTIETSIYATLKALVNNRVYRTNAEPTATTLPRITFQQVGGAPINYLDSATIPNLHNSRVQVNVWAARYDDATALARLVADALKSATTLKCVALNEFITVVENETDLEPIYGTIQDFSCWV